MTATSRHSPAALADAVKTEALRIGFDRVGLAAPVSPAGFHDLLKWLDNGYAGEMGYIERRKDAYAHPEHVLPGVKSIIMLVINYRTEDPPACDPGEGRVSRYAWGNGDYHDLLREKLRRLADFLHAELPGCRTRGIVDTAPLLERDFARLAGLGWFGKNTMLIHPQAGSWLFLAALLCDVELESDAAFETDHCGTCTRCLEACPTDAFPRPYVLDATRCISYLTIELRNRPIPLELREGIGNWLFGCDICQEVCPWNHKAPVTQEPAFQPVDELRPVDAVALLDLVADEQSSRATDDDQAPPHRRSSASEKAEQFRERFGHTPLARTGRAGLLRNACIVLGNAEDRSSVPSLVCALADVDSLVRGAAAWALGRLGGPKAMAALQSRRYVEHNPDVLAEIAMALDALSAG